MAVKIKIVVYWVVTPCSIVGDYLYFGRICCFHLQKFYLKDSVKSIYLDNEVSRLL
jgi:hypothetical protein